MGNGRSLSPNSAQKRDQGGAALARGDARGAALAFVAPRGLALEVH